MLLNFNDFNFGHKLLIFSGTWELTSKNSCKNGLYHVFGASMWFFFSICFMGFLYIDIYLVMGDLSKISSNCLSTVPCTMFLANAIVLKMKFRDFKNLKMEFDQTKTSSYRWIHERALREIKFLNGTLFVMSYITMTAWMFSPLLNERRKLPFRSYIFFSLDETLKYLSAYAYQVIYGYYFSAFLLGIGLSSYTYLRRIVADYEILESKIEFMKKVNEIDAPEIREEYMLRSIIEVIAKHQQIINRSKLFETAYDMIFLQQLLAFTLLFAVIGLNILTMSLKGINSDLFAQAIYLSTALFFVFIPYFYGTRIIQKSYDVVFAVYDTPWYEMNPLLRKYLILVMARAQKPPGITAGNLFEITLTTFLEMLKVTYQLFMLCRSFMTKEN